MPSSREGSRRHCDRQTDDSRSEPIQGFESASQVACLDLPIGESRVPCHLPVESRAHAEVEDLDDGQQGDVETNQSVRLESEDTEIDRSEDQLEKPGARHTRDIRYEISPEPARRILIDDR